MIAIVVPTNRPERIKEFRKNWDLLFKKHNAEVIIVHDGEKPAVETTTGAYSLGKIMGDEADLIYNFNDGVRNLGFAYVSRFLPDADTIVSLDDDVTPLGDTIADHLKVLGRFAPVTWLRIASAYTRGFPYGVRGEAEIVLSHGVWEGVADFDAPTQLVVGTPKISYYQGVIPKGVLYPHCAMNFAFKRKLLPYIYQAPMFGEINRFADIWGGIECKKDMDSLGWAVVTGYATVRHDRASNVFTNLIKEAKGLKMNEEYGKDEYFKLFEEKRERWKKWTKKVSGMN